MSMARDKLRWNGWGRADESVDISPAHEKALIAELEHRFGRRLETPPAPVSLNELRLPPTKVDQEVLEALRVACGDDAVRSSSFERVTHALGKSLPDVMRLRRGDVGCAPDVVIYPPNEGAVAAVLRIAAEAQLAVIPFGGGSSVVGGVEPRPDNQHGGALTLDTTHMDRLLAVDTDSMTATAQAGIDGPALEAALDAQHFTLGHFPQSFEHSTLGGWIAARSSGQFSNTYGGIEDLLVSLRLVTPEGVVRTIDVPRSATGPDWNEIVLGSEGTLGVITEATIRVRPNPSHHDERGMLFRSFHDGVATIRECMQEGINVAMLRLSNPQETELGQILRHDPSRRFDVTRWFLSAVRSLGYEEGRCAMIYADEARGDAEMRRKLARVRRIGRSHGGLPLGRAPGRSWRRDRFHTPYLRDWLLDRGVAVDTFETAFRWSHLENGHDEILRGLRTALEQHAGAGLAMAHLSHSYRDGGCLYFTFLYPVDHSADVGQWKAIKRDATDAVLAAGGTLSHHHGVGLDHAAWMPAERGTLGMKAYGALKKSLDPGGLMNPGKLL